MSDRRLSAAMLGVAVILASAAPAAAADRTVTLRAARGRVDVGHAVKLWGAVSPARRGELVRISDQSGRIVTRARTGPAGAYRTWIKPRRNVRLTARWGGVRSDPVAVRVRPHLWVHLRRVRLFGRARIRGAVAPAQPGRVKVRIRRNGKLLFVRRVPLRRGRRFATGFQVRDPGRYRAIVSLKRTRVLPARDASRSHATSLPRLRAGAHGPRVRLLERRLRRLRYHLPRPDWHFDFHTVDALRAFNKVQRRPRIGRVSESTWRALAHPRTPRPRAARPRIHIEVDQTKQVLYLVRNGSIARILHTSTGANGVTRDGVFHVHRKLEGYSPGGLYYPSYFDGLRAIHGWPEVPVSPASHGCARVPMWAAKWIYRRAHIGLEVRVYH